jgi:anti-anti-sigma regulatory factor
VINQEQLSDTEIVVKFSSDISSHEIQLLSNKIVHSAYRTVIIDLSEVNHLNYTMLGKLHMLKLDLAVRSKRLVFEGCSESLLNMLKLLQFDKTIEILRLSPKARHKNHKLQKNEGNRLPD